MNTDFLLIIALLLFVFSIAKLNVQHRILGMLTVFILAAIVTTSNIQQLFFFIINGVMVHILLLLTYREDDK
jgi:hypothetical protein